MNSKQLFFAYLDTILLTFATYSAHHFPLLEFLIPIFYNISNFPHIHYSVMWKYLCEFFSPYRARETIVYVLSHYCLQLTIKQFFIVVTRYMIQEKFASTDTVGHFH